ncbi:hypothetical protein KVR01_007377 [Diaporthe batatas]|uniref:uncharacterized protein n=1 Tax=Diaporthe batatas TaxID=748121 RepID=UPI001D059D41|nr:uncharacterized protein KVR01_007377 [Diaporthe batatas]KAG8162899.1 hypothetical protein KVR01_007377 [Diaporthe batatas]
MEGSAPPPGTGSTPFSITNHQNRRFNPAEEWNYQCMPWDKLLKYNPEKEYCQLQYTCPIEPFIEPFIMVNKRSMVVAIAGHCDNSGKPGAVAAWAVRFGVGSRFNAAERLDPGFPQTTSRAEIEALSQALDIIKTIMARPSERECRSKDELRFEVTFRSTSEDLCRVMWMPQIEKQKDKEPIPYLARLKLLRKKMDKMIEDENGRL